MAQKVEGAVSNGATMFAVALARFPGTALRHYESEGMYMCLGHGWGCDSVISNPHTLMVQWSLWRKDDDEW